MSPGSPASRPSSQRPLRLRPDPTLSKRLRGHALDPLTHLSATTRFYEHVPHRIHDIAHELCAGRWVATGGGGYDIWRVVPRAWTSIWAAVSHQELPERVPEPWLSKWSAKSPVRLPPLMRDAPEDHPQGPRVAKIAERTFAPSRRSWKNVCPASSRTSGVAHSASSRYFAP